MSQEEPLLSPDEEPEFFDRALLKLPATVRQEYFEEHCLIEHPRLLLALDAILQAICAPGEGMHVRRPGTMVLVIGPARVGKTTLIHLLEERLLAYAKAQMLHNPHFIPLTSIIAPEPGSGRFDWIDLYKPVLRQLGNPFVDSPTAPLRIRNYREALEAAYLERQPLATIVDEAHHLGKVHSGRDLQDHLDHLKHFENLTGISHILVGTYEMRPFRKVNPQLACRTQDVHFSRYDIRNAEDCQIFKSVLWALQRQLPVEEEPMLTQNYWEFLYARSIGCIGLLKQHLNRALGLALKEGSRTVSFDHLHASALSDGRVKLAMRNALESEAEFVEAEDADEQLLAELRQPAPRPGVAPQQGPAQSKPVPVRKRRVGKRTEGRDPIQQMTFGDGAFNFSSDEEQKAG